MTERTDVRTTMLWVGAALAPGLLTSAWWFGSGVLWQVLVAGGTALTTEAVCLRLRSKSLQALGDGSALVTALLIAAALPPTTPPGVTAIAAMTAIALAKQAFGGLGSNVFNPAMVGYAMVLVSFPAALSSWPAAPDALSAATFLDVLKHDHGRTLRELALDPAAGRWGARAFEDIALAYLLGGIALMFRRIVHWRIPTAVLLFAAATSLVFYDSGSSRSLGTPLQQWFSGGLLLAAFFIATDPVTHPRSTRGQWLFGAIVGCATVTIRGFGAWPDGIAFAILLANGATPYLDRRWP
ncbi:MAG: RnfABCDGE type electron transport complex subunit D [Pseudomonadales bacterium]|nr:RnfABCDGE type electron transport complex subunit D [Pseudomonadales bacterium]MCP5182407.1 RnfABCDGE type electron transport complex subunit D [Pseudomonadales bacterium]